MSSPNAAKLSPCSACVSEVSPSDAGLKHRKCADSAAIRGFHTNRHKARRGPASHKSADESVMVNKWLRRNLQQALSNSAVSRLGRPRPSIRTAVTSAVNSTSSPAQDPLLQFKPRARASPGVVSTDRTSSNFAGRRKSQFIRRTTKGCTVAKQGILIHTQHPQEVRPRPLAEFQIVGVIDIAGKIRVFVIDTDARVVDAAADTLPSSITLHSTATHLA